MEEILDNFCRESPSQQIYMITGSRGTGKTAFLAQLSQEICRRKDWIVLELKSRGDLLLSLASGLCRETELAGIFQRDKINLSYFGLGLEAADSSPVWDIETALICMLESLKKHGKRVLIVIDSVICSRGMRIFAGSFQIFIRRDLPVFLLLAGSCENIRRLQDHKTLTFLYRAPRMELGPVSY